MKEPRKPAVCDPAPYKPPTKAELERCDRLLKAANGLREPKYIHCYDNGGRSYDRYTIVFTGRYRHKTGYKGDKRLGSFWYIGASEHPSHPQGFGTVGENDKQIDYPAYGHLGKKVKFAMLPDDVRKFVWDVYADLWDLPKTKDSFVRTTPKVAICS